jgi:predicted nucleic acid-binding protein
MLKELQITVETDPPDWVWSEIFHLAMEHQLTTYDASYLSLAIRKDLPIATQDDALLNAAMKCGVPIYYPDPGHKWE